MEYERTKTYVERSSTKIQEGEKKHKIEELVAGEVYAPTQNREKAEEGFIIHLFIVASTAVGCKCPM